MFLAAPTNVEQPTPHMLCFCAEPPSISTLGLVAPQRGSRLARSASCRTRVSQISVLQMDVNP